MIERAITEDELISKFYQRHERVAKSWENYAQINHGQINGIVNSYIIDVRLLFNRNGKNISIKTIRQLTNSTRLLAKAPVIKNTTIEIKPIRTKDDNWKIIRNGKSINIFTSFFRNCTPYLLDNTYHLISKSRINHNLIIDKNLWRIISDLSDLEAISFKKQTLKIEYLDLISPENIEKLINTLEKKYGT
ncbi:hypothetical protein [Carboxylicivirga linearis]|uniref:Uncharacterized protein n=1 Tax=Carboxylicivirga linearis TaxID=1628157 RepID=A0ABS5K249_9BACT|nr:hypothetical protein [Carboxylicivirga linearis]MBS2101227.1 hypothetical protein [Carboxylicivirga linearis]